MEIVGYKLVRVSDDTAIQSWGGTWGQCPGIPNPLMLPNGDHVCGAAPGDTMGSYRLDAWMMDPPDLTPTDYAHAVQSHIDAMAQARGYGDAVSFCSYHDSTNATWAAEAGAFKLWRDAVWSYAFAQLAAVEAQQRSQPSVAELVGELPAMTWPR